MRPYKSLFFCSLAVAVSCVALSSYAANLSPWCVLGGGGKFLCTDKDEYKVVAKAGADLSYLEFVQLVFVANTISYLPGVGEGGSVHATTQHREGGGIDLSITGGSRVHRVIRTAANEWFGYFCFFKNGRVIKYPVLDDADLINVDRLACHPKTIVHSESELPPAMFGIEATGAPRDGGWFRDSVIVMQHLGTGEEVKRRWGFPKAWKPGDASNKGMVVEVKIPLARVQQEDGKDTWVKLVELEPKAGT